MKLDLIRQILAPDPTVADLERALRQVMRDQPELVVEAKVGQLYGSAFRMAEKSYDAGGPGRIMR